MALRRLLARHLWKPLSELQSVATPLKTGGSTIDASVTVLKERSLQCLRATCLPSAQSIPIHPHFVHKTAVGGDLTATLQGSLFLRQLSTSSDSEGVRRRGKDTAGKKALMLEEEEFDTITDKIPEKPMTAVESVSYLAIILAAFAVLGVCLWAFFSNYIWDPVEYTCFNLTLEKLRGDPRVTVRVGDVIKGYGSDSMNRQQRRMIRNRQYRDANGIEHTQIQFNIKGSGGAGVVYADMYQDASKQWQYTYLYVDLPDRGSNQLQRLAIVTPPV